MTVDEIFAKLNNHLLEGIMLHDQLASYYDFLNLPGYKRCHKYHAICEMKARRKLLEYYTCHFGQIAPEEQTTAPRVIPANWNGHTRKDVDGNTKRKAVKEGYSRWYEWEESAKELYERSYKELLELGEIAAAMEIGKLVKCASKELKHINREMLSLAAIDYDLSAICESQHEIHEKYKRMMKGG